MKVFMVTSTGDTEPWDKYETTTLIGIFSTEEKAMEIEKKINLKYTINEIEIDTFLEWML